MEPGGKRREDGLGARDGGAVALQGDGQLHLGRQALIIDGRGGVTSWAGGRLGQSVSQSAVGAFTPPPPFLLLLRTKKSCARISSIHGSSMIDSHWNRSRSCTPPFSPVRCLAARPVMPVVGLAEESRWELEM